MRRTAEPRLRYALVRLYGSESEVECRKEVRVNQGLSTISTVYMEYGEGEGEGEGEGRGRGKEDQMTLVSC